MLVSIVGNLILIGVTNILGLHISFFSMELIRWNQFMNPFLIMTAMMLSLLAKEKKFIDRRINYFSGLSMLIYIIHRNQLIKYHLMEDIFRYIYNKYTYQYELSWVCLIAFVLIIFGTLCAMIYRHTLQKITYKICEIIYQFLEPIGRRFMKKCLSFE